MNRVMIALIPLLSLTACGSSGSEGFDAGCFDGDDDGYKDGYANGFSCAENHYEQYDEYAAAVGDHPRPECESEGCVYYEYWIEGYAECYSGSYEEGLADGQTDAGCQLP